MAEPIVNERERLHAQELKHEHVPIEPWWFDENALVTILFNAASITIPDAERFVVSSVEEARPLLTAPELQESIEDILHEERAHARVHDAYNEYLKKHRYPVAKYAGKVRRMTAFYDRHCSTLTKLAICAITEHFTACGARQVLDVGFFEGRGVDERMDRVWTWHALEELDHRATVFDLYLELGGGYFRRAAVATIASAIVLYIHHACIFSIMRQRNVLWSWHTWRTAAPFLFGKKGIYRSFLPDWAKYYQPSFHPTKLNIKNSLQKQLHHYHIESELIAYFNA